jgi:hypothetical protein
MGSKVAIVALLVGVGCSSISSLISSGAGGYVYSSSANCSIQWSNSCVNGSETGNVTAEKYFGSNCATVYPRATLSEDGKTATRTCTTATIAGETFNTTGYTVSRGYIWNRKALTGYTPTAASISDCRQRCQDDNNCLHFARQQSDGMCYLNETDNSADAAGIKPDDVHVRGIKKDGTNDYSSPVFINKYYDGSTQTPPVKNSLSECMNKCTSNTACVAFSYRTNGHSWSDGKRTCILYNSDSQATNKYQEGFMGR